MFSELITVLYGASGMISTLLFLPQIASASRDSTGCQAISIPAWAAWTACTTVSLLYALMVTQQPVMIVVYLGSLLGHVAITAIALYKRVRHHGLKLPRLRSVEISGSST